MSGRIDYSKINLSVLPKGDNVVKATPKRVPIDYSKIDLKGTLPKVTGLSIPAKGRKIDYNAIEGPVVTPPVVRPGTQKNAGGSTPFIGRPLVTSFEQQRMKMAATPIPETKMTALSATSVRAPKFGEVPAAKFNEWFMSPGPNVPKNSKGQPVVPVRNLPFGDENPHLDWERTTDAGGNKVFLAPWNDPVVKNDAINKMYYSAGGILTGMVVFLATIVASSLGTRQAVKDLRTQEQKLGQAAEQGISEYQPMVDIKASAQTAAGAQRNANRTLGFISRNEYGAIQQFSDGEIRGLVTRAGWNMTDSEINNMIAGLRTSAAMPKLPVVSTDVINTFVNSTLKDSGTRIGNMTQLLLAIGDALPKSPPALANILAPLLAMQRPTQTVADGVEKDATTFFQNLRSEINTGSWERLAVPVGQSVTARQTVVPVSPTAAQPTVMPNIGAIPVIPTAPTIPTISQQPWEMADAERQVQISALRTQYKRELATPLMSEGSISPMQVGQMSKSQKARYQADTMTRMDVEAQIRLLENPQEARARYERGIAANKEGQIASLRANIKALELLGVGKKNTIKPKYQVQIDKDQAEIDRLLAPQLGPVLIAPQKGPSAEISNQELSMGTTPAHGLIDYSRIELNGPTSQTSPKVLASVGNTGKGFDNYIQNTAGTTDTHLSPFAKFKEIRDGYTRAIVNQYDWFFKSPLGGEWMAIAVAADDLLLEEYKKPFSINEAGEQVFVGGEFAPAILARYLKQYGPNFGKFLQHLQRAGISTEPTVGLSADKEALKQQHIADAKMSLVNFQKNEPQLSKAYMAAAQELGEANKLLAEFYKGIISPETYANDKAHPNYYVSLSAGKTDIFDRSGVAPLEKARGLTNLDEVVDPLPGLISVYIDAIRAQGINNAKKEGVKWNKNSEVATTELSDSIVHLNENGKDRAYEVHDKNAGASIRNLTRSKWEVPSLVKWLAMAPTTMIRLFATGTNIAFGVFNPVRDIIQAAGLVPFTPTGLVKGTVKAFKSPGLSQWSKGYEDPTRATGTKVTEAVKKIVEIVSIPSAVGETLGRRTISESIADRGGTYLDQFYGYHAGTGFFALHGTFFNDFIASCVPFTRATIAVVRAAYHNAFFGLPIGDKGGTFSGKQGAEKILGKNFLATIIFAVLEIAAIKAAGKGKEYKLLRDRASFFYLYQPSGSWVKLPVPIGSAPIKAIVDAALGFESDPMDVARQTFTVIPGLEALMLPPSLALYLQYKFNINFFTGSPIVTGPDTPAANPLEAAIMKKGYTEEQASLALRSFFADIPSQFQYVFDMVTQGSSTQAFPLSKRFIVKDPTTNSNAAVDDFYALVDAASMSKNPALEHYVNARGNAIGKLLHNAKTYPADAKVYITTATDNIIATFATIAENPETYGIKKFGSFSWRPKGNYEELAP